MLAVGFYPRPLLLVSSDLPRVGVADVVGHHPAVSVNFHAVIDLVPGAGFALRHTPLGVSAYGQCAAIGVGRADTVRLDDVQPQRIGVELRWFAPFEQDKHIPGHQPGLEDQLLQSCKAVQPQCVTVLRFAPKPKLGFGAPLPCLGVLGGEVQHIPVNRAFEGKAYAHHLGAVGVDGGSRHRSRHIEHPGALAQGGVVVVDVLVGRPAVGPETLERPPGNAGPGLAVSLGPGAGCIGQIQPASSIEVYDPHLLVA